MLHLVGPSVFIQKKYHSVLRILTLERSHVGSLFTNEEQNRLALMYSIPHTRVLFMTYCYRLQGMVWYDVFQTTHSGLIYDVTDTDCRAWYGMTLQTAGHGMVASMVVLSQLSYINF